MYRWVLSPVTRIVVPDREGGAPDVFRAAKVYEHKDPATGKPYAHSSVIHTDPWALSLVMAEDFKPLDADPLCISLFETDFGGKEHLDLTPRAMAFTAGHVQRIKNKLQTGGVDVAALTRDTSLAHMLNLLALALHPRVGDIRRVWLNPPPRAKIPFVEDAIIFQDAFTEGADTNLTAHTPSPTGTSWVQIVQTGTSTIRVIAATDDITGSGNVGSEGQLCKSQPDPSVNDYDVQCTINAVDTGTGTRRWRLHGRMTDKDNYYALRGLPTGHTTNDCQLIKNVAATVTVLATVDTGWLAADTAMLRIRDAAKEIFKNGASILSNADDVLTSVGSAGFSLGYVTANDNGNTGAVYRFDDYLVDEVAAGGGFVHSFGQLVG